MNIIKLQLEEQVPFGKSSYETLKAFPILIILTHPLPELSLESINVFVTLKSVDETLMCDHLNESY